MTNKINYYGYCYFTANNKTFTFKRRDGSLDCLELEGSSIEEIKQNFNSFINSDEYKETISSIINSFNYYSIECRLVIKKWIDDEYDSIVFVDHYDTNCGWTFSLMYAPIDPKRPDRIDCYTFKEYDYDFEKEQAEADFEKIANFDYQKRQKWAKEFKSVIITLQLEKWCDDLNELDITTVKNKEISL